MYAIFAKFLNICKQVACKLVNELGNIPRRGVVPKFSDLEIVALNMTSEAIGIDSESLLFAKLKEYKNEISNLISRRQYNDRRKNFVISYYLFDYLLVRPAKRVSVHRAFNARCTDIKRIKCSTLNLKQDVW